MQREGYEIRRRSTVSALAVISHVNRHVMLLNGVDSSASSGKAIRVSTEEHLHVLLAHTTLAWDLSRESRGWRGRGCVTGWRTADVRGTSGAAAISGWRSGRRSRKRLSLRGLCALQHASVAFDIERFHFSFGAQPVSKQCCERWVI